MRIQKSRMRCVGIFLAVVICFFALQQSYGAAKHARYHAAEPDHLAGTYDGAAAGFLP